jgi:hypothetical protein
MPIRFEWSARKARLNLQKHGVSFEEAMTCFDDKMEITIGDPDHSSEGEDRFLLLGMSKAGRLVAVSHTERGDRTRLISAREAARNERENYETQFRRRS